MSGKHEFKDMLVLARRRAGFKSAYQFYMANGGAGKLPFSFAHYTHIEKGRALPNPDHLKCILKALRFLPARADMVALLKTYLSEYLGGGAGAEYIMDVLSDMLRPSPADADKASWIKHTGAQHLSPEQFRAMTADPCTYWCSVVFSLDAEQHTASEISVSTGYPEKAVALSLEKLRLCGMITRKGKGYLTKFGDKMLTTPLNMEKEVKLMSSYSAEREKQEGVKELRGSAMVRMEKGALESFKIDLRQTVTNALSYSTRVKTDSTGCYIIRADIIRIGDF